MTKACRLHDPTDDACMVSRLIDENAQLREELRALRDDYEHMLRQCNAALRETLM